MRIIKTNNKHKYDLKKFWGYYEYLRNVKQMPHYKAFIDTKKKFRS